MTMERFFCELGDDDLTGTRVPLDRHQAHHARRVLRLPDGAEVQLFDGRGRVAEGVLVDAGSGPMVEVRRFRVEPLTRPYVTIASAIPKAGRVDGMVRQLSEVGADELLPMTTARSVVHPRPTKLDRLRQVALESAKQCGRSHALRIADIEPFDRVLGRPADVRLFAMPDGGSAAWSPDVERVVVMVGPEGGWADEEAAAARSAGATPWRFGAHVMRIETASVVAAAMVRAGTGGAGL